MWHVPKEKIQMNIPTKITLVRIILIPVFVAFFFIDPIPYNRIIAAGIFALASLTDWLDGFLARKLNQVTDLGKFLDPIADKLLVMAALVAIVALPNEFGLVIAICSMIILAREFAVSALRIIAASKNLTLSADRLGKVKTVLQMLSLLILVPIVDVIGLWPNAGEPIEIFGLILLAGATIMTLISGANYIIANRHVLKTVDISAVTKDKLDIPNDINDVLEDGK